MLGAVTNAASLFFENEISAKEIETEQWETITKARNEVYFASVRA